LTTTKALTKMTNCTFRAKKVEGHDQKFFPALWAGSVFKFIPAPHVLDLSVHAEKFKWDNVVAPFFTTFCCHCHSHSAMWFARFLPVFVGI